MRLLRFGVESALAAYYGRGILAWMQSTVFTTIVGALIVIAVTGTIVSLIAVVKGVKGKEQRVKSKG